MSPADRTDSRIKTSGARESTASDARWRAARARTIDLRGAKGDPHFKRRIIRMLWSLRRRPAPSGRVAKVADRMRSGATDFRRYDPVLLGCALALSLIGAVLVWSATRGRLLAMTMIPITSSRHLLNMVIGVSLGWVVTRVDYRTLRAYTPLVYGVVITLLLVVLSPFGTTINGAKAWITLPAGFTIQPGEFAKIVVILAMAMVLSSVTSGADRPSDGDVRQALIWAAAPLPSSCFNRTLGTVLIIGTIVIGIVAVSNARNRWVVGLIVAAIAGRCLQCVRNPRSVPDRSAPHVPDPDRDLQGIGYNTAQARIAIGGGGLLARDCSMAIRLRVHSFRISRPTLCSRWPVKNWG